MNRSYARFLSRCQLQPFAKQKGFSCNVRHLTTTAASGNKGSNNSKEPRNELDMAYGAVNAFQMNQYVIACTATRQAAIVDCGASSRQELKGFLQWISDRNYQLAAVWQTHAHLDHVAGLGLLQSILAEESDPKMKKNVPIYLHEKERAIYNSFGDRCRDFGFTVQDDGQLPEETELTYLTDNSQHISLGNLTFDIVSTPGYSPGHVGFLYQNMFLGGDFIMQGSIGRTDFPTSSLEDMQESLKRFVETMDEETIIYPGHGPPTTLKHEKQNNPILREFVE